MNNVHDDVLSALRDGYKTGLEAGLEDGRSKSAVQLEQARAWAATLEAQNAAALAEHQPNQYRDCSSCDVPWPCWTVHVLDPEGTMDMYASPGVADRDY